MITDELKAEIIEHIRASLAVSGEIGFGGNSTSPRATALDVPSGATTTLASKKTNLNVLEIKVTCAGSNITGKVIRELGVFKTSSEMIARVAFDAIGPITSSETLELFLTLEVN